MLGRMPGGSGSCGIIRGSPRGRCSGLGLEHMVRTVRGYKEFSFDNHRSNWPLKARSCLFL